MAQEQQTSTIGAEAPEVSPPAQTEATPQEVVVETRRELDPNWPPFLKKAYARGYATEPTQKAVRGAASVA